MALRWTTTDKAAASHGVKMMVYGRSGSGKTRLCATAPNPVILSAESGLLSLGEYSIPTIEISSIQDVDEAYRWLTGSKEADQFDTICIDSATEIAEVVLAAAKKSVKDPRQAYGELIDRMVEKIKMFRDISGKHVYAAAKQARLKDDESGRMIYGPSMPGQQLGQNMPYYFDEVFHLDIAATDDGTKYRYLRTQLDYQYDAKDSSGMLDEIERPDLTHIINKIMQRS